MAIQNNADTGLGGVVLEHAEKLDSHLFGLFWGSLPKPGFPFLLALRPRNVRPTPPTIDPPPLTKIVVACDSTFSLEN
jgi:hypothetical protein